MDKVPSNNAKEVRRKIKEDYALRGIKVTKFGAFKTGKKVLPKEKAEGKSQVFKISRPLLLDIHDDRVRVTLESEDKKWRSEHVMNAMLHELLNHRFVVYVKAIPDANGWISIEEFLHDYPGW